MFTVRLSDDFQAWLRKLRDSRAQDRIAARLLRAREGNLGDHKMLDTSGAAVGEMRIDYGPGYRLYFVRRGQEVVVLLCGGDKRSQDRDIKRAVQLAKEV